MPGTRDTDACADRGNGTGREVAGTVRFAPDGMQVVARQIRLGRAELTP